MVTLKKVDRIEPERSPALRVSSDLPLNQGQSPEIQQLNLEYPPRRHSPWPLVTSGKLKKHPIYKSADTNPGGNSEFSLPHTPLPDLRYFFLPS